MHLMQIVFLTAFIGALTAALARGGRPERIGAGLLFAAAIISPLAQRQLFEQAEIGIAVVDLLLCLSLAWLAQTSDRRWPYFAAAFQFLAVLTHVARLVADPVGGNSYATLAIFWSYPVMASLAAGSLIEARRPPATAPVDMASQAAGEAQDGWGNDADQGQRVPQALANPANNDHALLARLLSLHGLGPASDHLATELLERAGSFSAAVAAPATQVIAWGMEQRVLDALALARRTTQSTLKRTLEQRSCLANLGQVIDYLHSELAHLQVEQFRVLYLNVRHRLIHEEVHGLGTVNSAPVFPREIVKRAIEVGATQVILAHNHPSGDPTASRDDISITRAVIDALRPVGIDVADHVVIAASGHVSMRSIGMI